MKFRLLFFLLIITLPSFAQPNKEGQALIDSLTAELPGRSEDSIKVKILCTIAGVYVNRDFNEGIRYSLLAVDMAKRLQWKRGIALTTGTAAVLYSYTGNYLKALQYNLTALKINEELGNKNAIATTLGNIANIYSYQGDHNRSNAYNLRALHMAEQIRDTELIAINTENIGTEYNMLKKHDSARVYLFKALKHYERLGMRENVINTMINISSSYATPEDRPQSLEYLFKALEMSKEDGNSRLIVENMVNIGSAYLAIMKEPGPINAAKFIPAGRAANLRLAIKYLRPSLDSVKKLGLDHLMVPLELFLSDAYDSVGNYKEALSFFRDHIARKEATFSNDSKIKVAELNTQRETDLKEKQIQINRLEVNKRENERYLFVAGIILLVLVITLVLRSFKLQRDANRAQQEILAQKDMLMKEIHHRVKNNLQVISTLLDLQLDSIADPKARKAMTEGMSRIKSISLIHQQLYQNENITNIEFSKFTGDLLHQVKAIYKTQGQTITLVNHIDRIYFDIDTAVPLGLILNELMTNSYKHAFENHEDGSIIIRLDKGERNYKLIYTDSGPGMPAGLDKSSGTTLGMMVLDSLSNQLGGDFKYDSLLKESIVTFKDAMERKKIA